MSDKQITHSDIAHNDYEIDLLKLVGKKVKAILGYLSPEFGYDPSLKLTKIIFEDDTFLYVEGEHDFPYVVEGLKDSQPNFDDATWRRLYEEAESDD